MARSNAVWGIDIGNCSLKALRCRLDESGKRLVADAFDYIEYPKILTQPGAEQTELVHDALKQFLSRNNVRGDRVAISVPGQRGLARFIKLPPVESKKIPDIVRYEARQQIPFDLQDVVWDYQRLGGGLEEEGFVLEAEIGLFAMKRDQVYKELEPFRKVNIEVDVVQLTPLSLFNYLAFDQLQDVAPPDDFDPENAPPSIVILSLGTDATDLVITNGFRVWQRSIPIGGSNFTKALTKELKLTFAKAEHLKRNATTAQDPKAVFQAMRPVFNDLLTEIQRSIGYFTTIDRNAKIERMVAMGNAMKLPGLRRYLSQSLGFEVTRLESFENLAGPEVLNAAAFKENMLCFGVCYGLAVQALASSRLSTNLLPAEILKDRTIRAKKPWAVAAAALVLLGCSISFVSHSQALSKVDETMFAQAESAADGAIKKAADFETQFTGVKGEIENAKSIGNNLTGGVEGRLRWMELFKAISYCMPRDLSKGPKKPPLEERNILYINNIECQALEKLEDWDTLVKSKPWYVPPGTRPGAVRPAPAAPADPAAGGGTSETAATPPAEAGPTGSGYLVQISGYHYHNFAVARPDQGAQYIRDTLIENLVRTKVLLPKSDFGNRNDLEPVTMKELGISAPQLIDPRGIVEEWIPDPDFVPDESKKDTKKPATPAGGLLGGLAGGPGMGMPGMPGMSGSGMGMPGMPGMPGMGGTAGPGFAPNGAPMLKVRKFPFIVQFCWQPTSPSKRQEARAKAAGEAAPAGVLASPMAGPPATGAAMPPGVAPGTGAVAPVAGPPMVPAVPGTVTPVAAPPGTPMPVVTPAPGAAPAPGTLPAVPGGLSPPATGVATPTAPTAVTVPPTPAAPGAAPAAPAAPATTE